MRTASVSSFSSYIPLFLAVALAGCAGERKDSPQFVLQDTTCKVYGQTPEIRQENGALIFAEQNQLVEFYSKCADKEMWAGIVTLAKKEIEQGNGSQFTAVTLGGMASANEEIRQVIVETLKANKLSREQLWSHSFKEITARSIVEKLRLNNGSFNHAAVDALFNLVRQGDSKTNTSPEVAKVAIEELLAEKGIAFADIESSYKSYKAQAKIVKTSAFITKIKALKDELYLPNGCPNKDAHIAFLEYYDLGDPVNDIDPEEAKLLMKQVLALGPVIINSGIENNVIVFNTMHTSVEHIRLGLPIFAHIPKGSAIGSKELQRQLQSSGEFLECSESPAKVEDPVKEPPKKALPPVRGPAPSAPVAPPPLILG